MAPFGASLGSQAAARMKRTPMAAVNRRMHDREPTSQQATEEIPITSARLDRN